ncbi:MAG: response regulator [Bacteroidota bacterium]
MDTLIKILVVEDEMLIGAKISMQLTNMGYEVTGILPRGEEALLHVEDSCPDIILLDINLKGNLDGIQTAERLMQRHTIPIIYLTANSDDATFNRAKHTKPFAFISKPYKQLDLQRAIELTISRMAETATGALPDIEKDEEQPFILSDRIFVRYKDKMVKIMIGDILFMEADRNYSRIFTENREYLLSITLKAIEDRFTDKRFLRIHRSYIINLQHVDEVAESHVAIGQKKIPLSTGLKEQLLQRIQTL